MPCGEYRITPLGTTLRQPIDVLLDWAGPHLGAVEAARRAYDDGTSTAS